MTIETTAEALIENIKTIPRPRYLCLEEGTQSQWIFEMLLPYVDELFVTHQRKVEGNKDDIRDAYRLAEDLRIGALKPVFKDQNKFSRLRTLSTTYNMVKQDTVRIQNRTKALYRSRGISTTKSVYTESGREQYLSRLPDTYRSTADILYEQYDVVLQVKKRAQKLMIEESHKHDISRILETGPGLAGIRVAQLMSIIITPYRFRTKRQFWKYSGLGVTMRSSSDWEKSDGQWIRVEKNKTRGLDRRYNRRLKDIFKGAATTVISYRQSPLFDDYQRLLEQGSKPPIAKLTIARKIAAIVLAMWKNKEKYDPDKYRNKE
jgi:transposase